MWAKFGHILAVSVAFACTVLSTNARATTYDMTHWRAIDCATYRALVRTFKAGDVLVYNFPEGTETKTIAEVIGHGGDELGAGGNMVFRLTTGKVLKIPQQNNELFDLMLPFLEAYQTFKKTNLKLVKIDERATHPPDYIESNYMNVYKPGPEKIFLKNFVPGIENGLDLEYFKKLGITDLARIHHMTEKFFSFIRNSALINSAWDFDMNQVPWDIDEDDWVVGDFGGLVELFDPRKEAELKAKGEKQESVLDMFFPKTKPAIYSRLEEIVQKERHKVTVEAMICHPLLASLLDPVPVSPLH